MFVQPFLHVNIVVNFAVKRVEFDYPDIFCCVAIHSPQYFCIRILHFQLQRRRVDTARRFTRRGEEQYIYGDETADG